MLIRSFVDDCADAQGKMNNTELDGREIRVDFASERGGGGGGARGGSGGRVCKPFLQQRFCRTILFIINRFGRFQRHFLYVVAFYA